VGEFPDVADALLLIDPKEYIRITESFDTFTFKPEMMPAVRERYERAILVVRRADLLETIDNFDKLKKYINAFIGYMKVLGTDRELYDELVSEPEIASILHRPAKPEESLPQSFA
jgi:hypothetical protein